LLNPVFSSGLGITITDKSVIALWRELHLSLPFKIIPQQNFHITLAFLGVISKKQQNDITNIISEKYGDIKLRLSNFLQSNYTNTDALKLTRSQLGHFNKAQVLHLMPASSPDWLSYLEKVITELCQQSDILLDSRAYKPHLSLYRKAKTPLALPESLLLNTQFPNGFYHQLSIKSFSLYHSCSSASGVIYLPIHTWKLNY